MSVKNGLLRHYGFFYAVLEMHLSDVSAEDSIRQPGGEGNCLNWLVGHLADVQNRVMELVRAEPVLVDPSLDRDWDERICGEEDALDWDKVKGALLGSKDRCFSAIAALSEEELLGGEYQDPFGNTQTLGEILSFLGNHQIYHSGQIGIVRRLIGLPGVISQPKPPSE